MGFGYLFIGYFFMLEANISGFYSGGVAGGFDALPDALGFFIMLRGLESLALYGKKFKYAKHAALVGIVLGLVRLCAQFSALVGLFEAPATAVYIFNGVWAAFMLVFSFFVFKGIAEIAAETGVSKLRRSAVSNLIITPIFIFGALFIYYLLMLDKSVFGEYAAQAAVLRLILSLLWVIVGCFVIFSAYARICEEGDEDMEPREGAKKWKSPFDYYDKRREREKASSETHRKKRKRK